MTALSHGYTHLAIPATWEFKPLRGIHDVFSIIYRWGVEDVRGNAKLEVVNKLQFLDAQLLIQRRREDYIVREPIRQKSHIHSTKM